MRILYFTGQIALHGGIEKVTVMKLNYWVETGNDVYLSTYEQGDKPFVYPISSKVHYEDLNINYNVDYTYESLYSFRGLKDCDYMRSGTSIPSKPIASLTTLPTFWLKARRNIFRASFSSRRMLKS